MLFTLHNALQEVVYSVNSTLKSLMVAMLT
jgi:hypothetical protein